MHQKGWVLVRLELEEARVRARPSRGRAKERCGGLFGVEQVLQQRQTLAPARALGEERSHVVHGPLVARNSPHPIRRFPPTPFSCSARLSSAERPVTRTE